MSVDRLHRAAWVSTELLLTFPPPALTAVTVLPLNADDTTGRFRVWLEAGSGSPILIWDRKVNGGFPELKVLVSRMTTKPGCRVHPCTEAAHPRPHPTGNVAWTL